MPFIMIFQKTSELLSAAEISELMKEILGYGCEAVEGDAPVSGAELHRGRLYVHLEDLDPSEGKPEVQYEALPRLDRDDTLQKLIDEIVEQDPSLGEEMNRNTRDILITFPDTDAATDAGYAVAYIVAAETESGLLLPSFDEETETLWFSDAEEFYSTVFEEEGDLDEDEDWDLGDEEVDASGEDEDEEP